VYVTRIGRAATAVGAWLRRRRDRSPLVDHVWRAALRYDRENGSQLAAATAYYGFFATFALAVLLFAILDATLSRASPAQVTAEEYLHQNLPPLRDVHALADASRGVSVLAVGALILAGVWWIESLRASERAMWNLNQHPGGVLVRYLVDLAVLVGLGALLIVSVGISLGLQDILLRVVGDQARPLTRHAVDWSSALLAVGVDLLLSAALLAGVPRLRIPWQRLLPSALLIVAGLTLLKTAGRWYVDRTTHNPAYQVAAGAIGLLVFMYLFNQVILFASAFAATGTHGRVIDLAGGPRPEENPDAEVPPVPVTKSR
jgi:membrane protein